ncbi:MAG: DUF3037 domain-containing protein [Opitutaceae bacterium]
MKIAYSYVILRYVHDVVTGEFANIGIVVYAPDQRVLKARFTTSYERLNAIFLKIDHAHFRAMVRYLGDRFAEMAAELRDSLQLAPVNGIAELVRKVLPQDDSTLQWSETSGGLTSNLEQAAQDLYARLVERYERSTEQQSRSDEDIARPFKTKLDEKKVGPKISEKKIAAKDYDYNFQFAWKNSIWHLYEPVSFDLMDPNSIVEKANKWLGRGVALQDADEQFKLYFLLGEPKQPGTRKAFEHAQHLLQKIPGQRKLVRETELEAFTEKVADDIARHDRVSA